MNWKLENKACLRNSLMIFVLFWDRIIFRGRLLDSESKLDRSRSPTVLFIQEDETSLGSGFKLSKYSNHHHHYHHLETC